MSSIHHSFQAYLSVMLSIACFGSRKLQMYKLSTNTSSVLYGRVLYWRNPLQCYIIYGIFELPSWGNQFRNFVNKSWIAEVTHRLNNWRFKWKQPFTNRRIHASVEVYQLRTHSELSEVRLSGLWAYTRTRRCWICQELIHTR